MIELKLYNYLDAECENNWKNFEQNEKYGFFQSCDYIKNLLALSENKLKIIFIYLNKELVGILPFEIKKLYGLRVLQWIGNNRSDYCTPLLSSNLINYLDEKKFLFLWEDIKKKINSFDLIFLNNQLSKIINYDNPFVKFLNNIKKSKIYKISLDQNFEKYLLSIKNKDKNHAYELHRVNLKLRKLKNETKINFEVKKILNNFNDLNLIFQKKAYLLKFKGNKHFLSSNFFNVFKNLIKNSDQNFYLAKLFVNNELISACFLIIYNDILYYYMPISFSEKYNKFKPGKILIYKIIEWSILQNIKFLDFGLGEEGYKRHFSNNILFVQKHLYYNSLIGRLVYFFIKLFLRFF